MSHTSVKQSTTKNAAHLTGAGRWHRFVRQ